MKSRSLRLVGVVAWLLMLAGGLAAQRPESAQALLRAAIDKETVDGDVRGAIVLYQAIVDRFLETDRATVAKALMHMAGAHERFGNAEARRIYQRLVSQFPDQREAAAAAQRRLGARAPEPGLSSRRVWTLPADAWLHSVSRDGRSALFTAWSKQGNLFIRDLVSGTDQQLTHSTDHEQHADAAVASRDGMRVAYGWCSCLERAARSEIRLLNLKGLPQSRVLYTAPDGGWITPFDWSHDGRWLAVVVSRDDRTRQLGTLSVPEGALRILKSFTEAQRFSTVAVSPDGRHLAFDLLGERTLARDIHVIAAADPSRTFPVVEHPSDDALVGWSSDGARIVFASDRGESASLWTQEFAGTRSTAAPISVRRDVGSFWPVGLTTSGALYSIQSASTTTRLKVITIDFANGTLTSPPTDTVDDGLNRHADYSRDGKQMVYVSGRPGVGGRQANVLAIRSEAGLYREMPLNVSSLNAPGVTPELFNPVFSPEGQRVVVAVNAGAKQGAYLVDFTTGEQVTIAVTAANERLTGPAAPATAPFWSADGAHIYYRRITSEGFRLFTFDVKSGTHEEIFRGTDPQGNAAVSRDGRKIYYRRLLGPSGQPPVGQEAAFVERDLATGAEREVTRRHNLGGTNLSPDGRHLVTASVDPTGASRSMLMISVEDGSTRELLKVDLPAGPSPRLILIPLAWAPDSQSILLQRVPAGQPVEVWWAPVDGREPRRLLTLPNFSRVRIHPDGQRVVFSESESTTAPDELMVLENFLPRASGNR
jgi:Tol biopolymer transport system component